MDDVKRLFLDDAKEKKITGYSAHKKAYTSRRVRFPSDYLTEKEKRKMNSSVSRYNLNQPMTWAEFKALPDDLKKQYIYRLRNLYQATAKTLAEMFGVTRQTVALELVRLDIPAGPKGLRTTPEFKNFCAFGTPVKDVKTDTEDEPRVESATCHEPDELPKLIKRLEAMGSEAPPCETRPKDKISSKAFGALYYALGTLEYLKLCDMPSYADGALSRVVSDIRDFVDNAEVYV